MIRPFGRPRPPRARSSDRAPGRDAGDAAGVVVQPHDRALPERLLDLTEGVFEDLGGVLAGPAAVAAGDVLHAVLGQRSGFRECCGAGETETADGQAAATRVYRPRGAASAGPGRRQLVRRERQEPRPKDRRSGSRGGRGPFGGEAVELRPHRPAGLAGGGDLRGRRPQPDGRVRHEVDVPLRTGAGRGATVSRAFVASPGRAAGRFAPVPRGGGAGRGRLAGRVPHGCLPSVGEVAAAPNRRPQVNGRMV